LSARLLIRGEYHAGPDPWHCGSRGPGSTPTLGRPDLPGVVTVTPRGDVVREEGLPGLRGRPSPPRHDPSDRALRDCEAQLEKLAVDPGGIPERVGARHLLDQDPELRANRRASWPSMPRLPGPPGAKALAMPADDGRGLYQEQSLAPARPAAGKLNPEGLLEPSELRPLRAVVQESKLLPKGKGSRAPNPRALGAPSGASPVGRQRWTTWAASLVGLASRRQVRRSDSG
jgi:hypothetical protein